MVKDQALFAKERLSFIKYMAKVITQEKIEELLARINDGVVVVTSKEKIEFLNAKMAEMLGYSVEEGVGKKFTDFVAKEYVTLMLERRDRRLRGESVPARYEVELVARSGERIPVEINTSVIGYNGEAATISVVRDVLDRKKLELALKESEALFRAVFEQSAVGISIISPDGRWLRANEALSKITGYSTKEMLQKKFVDITHPDDIRPSREAREKLLSGEVSYVELDKRYIRKNKEIVWVSLSITLIRDEQGAPKYFLALTQDIDARKDFESSLDKKISDMERLNKVMVGRELKMIELKKEIAELKKKIN